MLWELSKMDEVKMGGVFFLTLQWRRNFKYKQLFSFN